MTKTEQYIEKLKEYIKHLKKYSHTIKSKCYDRSEQQINRITNEYESEIATLESEMSEQKEISELQKLMNDIAEWSDKQFGEHQRNPGIVYHLESEVKELIDRFEKGVVTQEEIDNLKMEFADCMMLLLDSATHSFFTADDLFNAVRQKLEINKQRKWGTTNDKGFTEHIKSEQKPVKDGEYFVKVYIKSEDDLPKKGSYICHFKSFPDNSSMGIIFTNHKCMSACDWYLLPVDAMPKTEFKPVKSAEIKTIDEIMWDHGLFTSKYHRNGEPKEPQTESDKIEIQVAETERDIIKRIAEEFASQTDLREELIKYEHYCNQLLPHLPVPLDEEESMLKLIDEYLKTKQ